MAIALVSNVAYSAGGSSGGTSSSIDTTGATCLIAIVGNENVLGTFSDSKSNVWTQLGLSQISGSAAVSAWIAMNPTVGSGHTFTAGSSTSFPTFCVGAFSGVATSFALHLPMKTNNATATSIQAGSITPAANNCVVIAGMAYRDTTTISINGGFSITNQNPFIGATAVGSAMAYLVQTSAAAANPTWSWTNSLLSCAILLALQPTPASGGGSYATA